MDRSAALDDLIARIGIVPDRAWIQAGAINTHYLKAGVGFPLVLVHGGGAGAVQWHRVIGTLSKSFTVIAPDVVGYGETDKPIAPYDRDYFVGWLRDFTNAIGLNRFHLVAASQSGPAASQFTVEHEHRVDRLALVDSAGFQKQVPVGALFGMLWLYSFPSQRALRWYSRYLVHHRASLDDALSTYAVGVIKMSGGRRAFWQGKGRAVEPLPETLIKRLSRSVLFLWGKEDRLFALGDASRRIEKLPRSQLKVLSGAGHLSFLDQPAEFCRSLLAFLEQDQGGAS